MKQFEFDLADLDDAQEAPVRKLLKMVLLISIRDRATLLRFQHEDRCFRMFEKVNGVFLEMVPPPRHLANHIINLLRVMAHLDYASAPRPQRGFGHVRLGDYVIHLFVAIRPGSFGDTADVSLLYSPEAPAEAEQGLASYRCTDEEMGAIVVELEEPICGEELAAEDEDYFLRR